MFKIIIIILFSFMLLSCGESPSTVQFSDTGEDQRENQQYLAYKHSFQIDASEENVPALHRKISEFCSQDKKFNCTILEADLRTSNYTSSTLRMRLQKNGISEILSIIGDQGEILAQSLNVEDLAKPIVDFEQRMSMLTDQRDKLIALKKRAVDDIDSLIKITKELSAIQNELEYSTGERNHLLKRTELDILVIQIDSNSSRSFWLSISDALSDFSDTLSKGIADSITGVAYILPWLIVIVVLGFVLRSLWRFTRK